MTNPQEVQFGNQPPKNADVAFGKHPEADETSVSVAGDSEPASHGDESAPETTEPASGDEDTSDGENAPENADQA